jgi:hypothetical protein
MKYETSPLIKIGILFCYVLFFNFWERRIVQRSKRRNENGLCAKCEKEISPLSPTIAVGGGKFSRIQAVVCDYCKKKSSRTEKITYLLLVFLLVSVFLFFWVH